MNPFVRNIGYSTLGKYAGGALGAGIGMAVGSPAGIPGMIAGGAEGYSYGSSIGSAGGGMLADYLSQKEDIEKGLRQEVDPTAVVVPNLVWAIPGPDIMKGGLVNAAGKLMAEGAVKGGTSEIIQRGVGMAKKAYNGEDVSLDDLASLGTAKRAVLSGLINVPLGLVARGVGKFTSAKEQAKISEDRLNELARQSKLKEFNNAQLENQNIFNDYSNSIDLARQAHESGVSPEANFIDFQTAPNTDAISKNEAILSSHQDPLMGQYPQDILEGRAKLNTQPETTWGKITADLQRKFGYAADKLSKEPMYYADTGELASGASGKITGMAMDAAAQFEDLKSRINDVAGPEVQKATGWDKLSPSNKKFYAQKIAEARQNPEKAQEIIQGTGAEPYYKMVDDVFNQAQEVLKRDNRGTIEAYFPKQGLYVQPHTPQLLGKGMDVNIESPRLKSRTGGPSKDIEVDDIMKYITGPYTNSVMREVAFSPVDEELKKYSNNPKITKALEKIVYPEVKQKGAIDKVMGKVGQTYYKAFIESNPGPILKNKAQQDLTEAYVSSLGSKVGKEIMKSPEEYGLADYLKGGYSDKFGDIGQGSLKENNSTSFFDKLKFTHSEAKNWEMTRAKGFGEAVAQSDEFKKAIGDGASIKDAFKAAIESNPEIINRGKIRGNDLTRAINLPNTKWMLPEVYEGASPIAKGMLRFTRTATGLPEVYNNILTRGGQEARILSRGISEEAKIVDLKRAFNQFKSTVAKEVKAGNISKDVAQKYYVEADDVISMANKAIDQIEPRDLKRSLAYLGKAYARNTAVGSLLGTIGVLGTDTALEKLGLSEPTSPEKKAEKVVSRIKSSAVQALPLVDATKIPMQALGLADANFGRKKTLIDLGIAATSMAPGLGWVNQLNQIPGRPVTKSVINATK